jgi:predicted transcriptional regulator
MLSYPIVSRDHSAARSNLAVDLGLGKRVAAKKQGKRRAK